MVDSGNELSPSEAPSPSATQGLARSASLLALGSLVSRALGLLREMVIAALFGATGQVSAFRVAAQVPTLLYDFLVGGMLSAALVPVLSDYARRGRREFRQVVAALAALFVVLLTVLVIALELTAPLLASLLAGGFRTSEPALLELTTRLIRWTAPVVWFLSMAGVMMAVLYAQQRFTAPALATAVFNLGIVVAAPLLAPQIGVFSLAVGLLLGSLAQLAVMTFDAHRAGLLSRLRIDRRHPALRRVFWLYLPIAAGMVVSLFQVGLDRRLASGAGEQSIAWMANATTLQQMPLGLISVAISLAALPQLSRHFVAGDERAYRQTLARGLRMVWMLVLPTALALWVLGTPVTRLLFERGAFTPVDTEQVVRALNIYLIGMLFAAVDFPLNFAFYARFNTWLPAAVGAISVLVYTAVALTLLQRMGFLGLVWADTAKQAGHAAIMVFLLWRVVGRPGAPTLAGFARITLAGAAMAGVMVVLARLLERWSPAGAGGALLTVVATGGVGFAVYAGVLFALRAPEAHAVAAAVRSRIAFI
ncbi:MAG: murein biosynthesis integral membrane protein MurJ [Caldilinea sp.]|nr:murein biosynthesis integral membrane protein MurJ [Caldilinea sp.]MDW8439039.1 murein biosynthesis integral membrane protein MurJ [Caldilineaceae bacterium]